MDIEFGHLGDLDTQGTGWFIGYSDWVRSDAGAIGNLRYMPKEQRSHALTMKWMDHAKGDPRGGGKPLSEGRTLSILVGKPGRFRLQFSRHADFPPEDTVEHVLERNGDFSLWGEGIHHRYAVDADCTILTLRWVPEPANTGG
ncbi:hypothetical protein [Noviherbaspirillum malthae]|jgi:hypothetical protein|uniref:hypothetical protein n=1 Tax=Noviherbaspirillum malthae TaxID=1260987 RepID=UPI00188E488A|nr:hypothetical protein [Noviherbaspirillum malthae]